MKTMFSNGVFGRYEFVPLRLAQAAAPQTAFSVFGELLEAVGVSEEDINKLLEKLPKDAVGNYQKQLDECKAKGVTTTGGAACLYKLYQDMKAASERAPAPVVPPRRPPGEGFPVWALAIGGLAAAGLVVYLATKG